jgi:hypothetical protein
MKKYNTQSKPINKISLVTSWVNFQKANEGNPEHIHDNDFSFVIYLKIPPELKEENAQFTGRNVGPGGITFRYGETSKWNVTAQVFFPEECELFIFPASLSHWVTPYTSNCERISLSGNLKVTDNAN